MLIKLFKRNSMSSTGHIREYSPNGRSPSPKAARIPECPVNSGSPSKLRRSETQVKGEDEEEKLKLCSKIRNKAINSINSRTFRALMIIAAVLNVLQLIAFFLIGVLYLPERTKKNLNNEDIYFMMDHIDDNYVDYDFFINESIL